MCCIGPQPWTAILNFPWNSWWFAFTLNPAIGRAYFKKKDRLPKYAFGYETDRQGRYKRTTIGKIDVLRTEPNGRRLGP